MQKIFTQIFVSLGVIFLILILIGIYYFVTDPLDLKPLIFGTSGPSEAQPKDASTTGEATQDTGGDAVSVAGGFQLSAAQKQALVSFGIDPATVPSSLSAEQEACFVGVLGKVRVAEIKNGAVPSALEFYRAKSCV